MDELHVVEEPVRNVLMPTAKSGQRRHGLDKTPTHGAWWRMVMNCTNPRVEGYRRYGAKGVKIAFKWLKFEGFLADMGIAPPAHSLVRIDESGDFEPGNCKWAPRRRG